MEITLGQQYNVGEDTTLGQQYDVGEKDTRKTKTLPWQVTMDYDQIIYAALSHTHYWYEVGMLNVPAYIISMY